jgi:hypothetical protein
MMQFKRIITIIIVINISMATITITNLNIETNSNLTQQVDAQIINEPKYTVCEAEDCSMGRNAYNRAGWLDTFNNESLIENNNNLNLTDGNIKLSSSQLFLINSTFDFDAGIKTNIETHTDNPSIPGGEIQMVANKLLFIEGFDGTDEQDLTDYDSTWSLIYPGTITTASAKIDTDESAAGTASVRFYATDGTNRIRATRNIGAFTTLSTYVRAGGPGSPVLTVTALNGNDVITTFYFYSNSNIWYYNGSTNFDTGYDYTFNTWYNITTKLDFPNQEYDVYIDGGIFNDFLIVQDAAFMNAATSVNTIRIGNWDAWGGQDSNAWYDNLITTGYQTSATWQSAPIIKPFNQQLLNTTLEFSNLATGLSSIDKIEWLVGNTVKASYQTVINNDVLSPLTLTDEDLTSGSFQEINSDFTIKLYLSSDGFRTPIIKKIEGSSIYTEGNLTSLPISIPVNNIWDKLLVNKSESIGNYINVSVLNASTNEPISGFSKLNMSVIDLASINSKVYPNLKLDANFSTENFNSAILHDWTVTWVPDQPKLNPNIPSDWAFPEDTDANNLINLANYFEDVWTPDDKLEFQLEYESDDTHIDANINGTYLDFTTPTVNWSGYETFKIKCTDEGGLWTLSNEFKVTATEVNDPPAWEPLSDIHVDEDSSLVDILNLDEKIYDCDDSYNNITYSITSNSDEENFFALINNRHLFVEPETDNYYGDVVIGLRADDGSAFADTSVNIIIDPLNDPPNVELRLPENNSIIYKTTNYYTNVRLTWDDGIDIENQTLTYDVYLDEINPPSAIIEKDIIVTSYTTLLNDGTYYWKIVPNDGEIDGFCKSGVWSFTVVTLEEPPILPPTITLASPYNNSIVNTTTVNLEWNANTSFDDLTYYIYLDTDPELDYPIDWDITQTNYIYTNLEDGVTYYWKVIPLSGSSVGSCIDNYWSFTVQLDFIPEYNVDISGIESIKMNQSEKRFYNLTIINQGNIRDIYEPELEAGLINDHVEFTNLRNIMLEPGDSARLQLMISIPENFPTGEYNIEVEVSSFWGGKTVNDTHYIKLEIEPKNIEGPGTKSETGIEIFIWLIILIIIILILIAIALFTRRRKQKLEEALAEKGISKPGLATTPTLPATVSGSGTVPQLGSAGIGIAGQTGTASVPTLTPSVTTTPGQYSLPQVARPAGIAQLPPAQPTGVTSSPTSQPGPPPEGVSYATSPLPEIPIASSQDLSKEEKIEILEDKLLKGEIDLATYKELRQKLETDEKAWVTQTVPRLPPASQEETTIPQVDELPSKPLPQVESATSTEPIPQPVVQPAVKPQNVSAVTEKPIPEEPTSEKDVEE